MSRLVVLPLVLAAASPARADNIPKKAAAETLGFDFAKVNPPDAETLYPSAQPDVWYGSEAVDGRRFYLFDRRSAGVIKWDSETDTGTVIPWPYDAPLPSGGRLERETTPSGATFGTSRVANTSRSA